MRCSKCGHQSDDSGRFCRKCGTDAEHVTLEPVRNSMKSNSVVELATKAGSKDPDELIGNGLGSVFVGDGFFIVAVLLSATNASISSILWLVLLIPAFFFFGKGVADLFHARQIQRRLKQSELASGPATANLQPARASVIDVF